MRPARSLSFQGRRSYFDDEFMYDADVPFNLKYDQKLSEKFINYSMLPIAIWDADFIWYLNGKPGKWEFGSLD